MTCFFYTLLNMTKFSRSLYYNKIMKIYIDLLFIQDSIMMINILYIVSRLTKTYVSLKRIITISVLSTIVSILLLIYIPQLYSSLIAKIVFSSFIIKFLFRDNKIVSVFQKTMLFLTVCMLFGRN